MCDVLRVRPSYDHFSRCRISSCRSCKGRNPARQDVASLFSSALPLRILARPSTEQNTAYCGLMEHSPAQCGIFLDWFRCPIGSVALPRMCWQSVCSCWSLELDARIAGPIRQTKCLLMSHVLVSSSPKFLRRPCQYPRFSCWNDCILSIALCLTPLQLCLTHLLRHLTRLKQE
ncbi:hypothetical protein BD413DRAFT_84646 [Trametes elegans]|nr:hypothetical protein BD413DRAFT_84646 [Trametes elegans]